MRRESQSRGFYDPGEFHTPTALITGAAHRIGLLLVELLLEQGFQVFANYRTPSDQLSRLAERNSDLTILPGDLTDPTGRAALCETARQHGRLDLLINNASLFYRLEPPELTAQDYLDFYRIHVIVPSLLVQELKPLLEQSHGRVINLLDARDRYYRGGYTPYAVSRLAAREMTRLQAQEADTAFRVQGLALEQLLPAVRTVLTEGEPDPDLIRRNLQRLREAVLELLTGKLSTGEILTVRAAAKLS